jgi:four helix bundle protein
MSDKIQHHWQLDVYKLSVEAAMKIFELSRSFPKEETYSLTDHIRRSPRSVLGQIGEGWRRRRYGAAFANKLNEAEGEAAETQVWLEYAVRCGYMSRKDGQDLHRTYDCILGKLVVMINWPAPWLLKGAAQ